MSEVEVDDQRIWIMLIDVRQSAFGIRSLQYVESSSIQDLHQETAQERVILDDQHLTGRVHTTTVRVR